MNLANRKVSAERKRMDLLRTIDEFWLRNYRAPTIRELCVLSGDSSTSHVKWMMALLERDGFLRLTNKVGEGTGKPIANYVPRWVVRQIDGIRHGRIFDE